MKFLKREPVVVNPLITHDDDLRVSLSGEWLFRLDPNDVGIKEQWFLHPFVFLDHIKVPGCWQGQGFGNDDLEMHKEFFTAIRPFRATYEGTGWYKKSFTVPAEWSGKRIWLNFGGSNPTTEIWLNGELIGEHHSPLVPFGFDITERVDFDGENILTVRISELDRTLGLTYHYCGKWSGLYRDVELCATGDSYINSFSVLPDANTGNIKIKAEIENPDGELKVSVKSPDGETVEVKTSVKEKLTELDIKLDEYKKWSPDSPELYTVSAELKVNGETSDVRTDRFGFIALSTEGKHFLINGEPYYMRGTGDFGENPETGSPNTDRDHWRKCLSALRAMGYNYVRCQSYVPVPEYFDAADEVGIIIQSEMGVLGPIAGHSMYHSYNMWPKPSPDYREPFRVQWNNIVMRDVNHPSANIYCMSNELNNTFFPKTAWRCYNETKAMKPSCFVIWTDGGYHTDFPADFVNDQAQRDAKCDLPVIQHEFKWWSSYPDVRLVEKYKNTAMRHFSAELMIEVAGQRGLTHILPKAAENTQVLQFIEAKCKMEQRRRDFPTLAGICHFNAMDTGMSSQGLIDMFYEQKYVTPEVWQRTNGDTVIMNSLDFDNRILTPGMEWKCDFFVSDFSHPAFSEPTLEWSLEIDGDTVAEGSFKYEHEAYKTIPAGQISANIPSVKKPACATLKAKLTDGERCAENAWDLWVFPNTEALPEGVYRSENGEADGSAKAIIAERLTEELVNYVKDGGSLILIGSEGLVRPFSPFLSLTVGRYFFTRPASFPPYEDLQSGTIICDHPMFGDFPHGAYADLQFYNMIAESPALDLEPLELTDTDPVIRMLHSYQVGRQLGYIIERRMGKGNIIVTSLNLSAELAEARYLLGNMANYAKSRDWADAPEISESAIEKLVSGTNIDP